MDINKTDNSYNQNESLLLNQIQIITDFIKENVLVNIEEKKIPILNQILKEINTLKLSVINLEKENEILLNQNKDFTEQLNELEKKYESMKMRLTDTYNQFARDTQMF